MFSYLGLQSLKNLLKSTLILPIVSLSVIIFPVSCLWQTYQEPLYSSIPIINKHVKQHKTQGRPLWNSTYTPYLFLHLSIYNYPLLAVNDQIMCPTYSHFIQPMYLQFPYVNVVLAFTRNLTKVQKYYALPSST